MTIKELYEWAVKEGVENYDLCVCYRDEGGCHWEYEILGDCDENGIDNEMKEVIL